MRRAAAPIVVFAGLLGACGEPGPKPDTAAASCEVQTATGMEKSAPCEDRTTFGLKTSVIGSQTMRASQPAESAVRSSAPRLPGFSTDSATSRSGLAEGLS